MNSNGVFTVMEKKGLTTLEIFQNRKEGKFLLRGAKKLADAGILFVVDWVHNAGGVLTAWTEWIWQEKASFDKIKPRIELVCRDNFRKLLQEARRTGRTPTKLIYEQIEHMVYSGAEFGEE